MTQARAYLGLEKVEQAIEACNRAIELNPRIAAAYAVRASAFHRQREDARSQADWTEALRLGSEDSETYLGYGVFLVGQGQPKPAIKSFTEAIRLDPKNNLAYAERGFAYAELGDSEKAEANWQEAMRLDPTSADRYIERGDGYRTGAMLDQAIAEYTRALQLDPEAWKALQGRGDVYLKMSQLDDAIADYHEAFRISPNAWQPVNGILKVYSAQGNQAGAVATFSQMIEQNPSVRFLYTIRARAYSNLGQWVKAFRDFDEAISSDLWGTRGYLRARARCQMELGRYDRALADYQTAIDMDPEKDGNGFKRVVGFARRGDIYLDDLRQYDEAVAEYTKAIDLSPADWTLLSRRAIARQRAGDQAGSQVDVDTLLSLDHDNPLLAHCRLASLYVELDRDEEAMDECLKAIDVTPPDASLATLRAGLLLLADRSDLYRETCADALKRFGGVETPQTRIYVARCCILAPEAVADPTQPVSLAKLGVASAPHSQWFLHTLGMAHLRAGQHDEAEQRLRESLEADPAWHARRQNYLGLALVHHARGDLELARDWYAKAVAQIDQRPASYTQNVHDWIEAHLLRREAEQLLGPPKQPRDNTETD